MNALRHFLYAAGCGPLCAAVLAGLVFPAAAGAGVVRTLDGKTYEGTILLGADGTLSVQRKKEATVNVDLANLMEADFKAETSGLRPPAVVDDRLPIPWSQVDIGRAALPGSVRCVDGAFYLKGAGMPMENRNDSFFYIYQPLRGDCQLVVHMRDFQMATQRAKLGLFIRDNLLPMPREAMLMLSAAKGLRFYYRADSNVQNFTPLGQFNHDEAPLWLMLARHGKTIIASKSSDAKHWDVVGHVDLPMTGKDATIGIGLTSGDPNAMTSAICENVNVWPYDEHPQAHLPETAALTKSVALKSGTVVGDATLVALSDQTVRFNDAQGHSLNVPMSEVARLSFMPLSAAILAKIPEHITGVLKPGGDFIEGEFTGLDAHHVKLSSVLFGIENLSLGDEAAVLVLRDMKPATSALIVQSADGSNYLAKSLSIDREGVTLDELTLGTVRVAAAQLVDIKAGSQRLQWLDALKPVGVETPAGVGAASAWTAGGPLAGKPLALAGSPCQHPLCLLTGAALIYRLDGPYKLLTFRCGIPDAVLPTVSAQLIVSADSKEILRTPLRTSLDDPQTFSLAITGAKTISLRVQSDAPLLCPLLCDGAQLVK